MFSSFLHSTQPRSPRRLVSWVLATGFVSALTSLAVALDGGEAPPPKPEEEPLQVVFASELPKAEPEPEPEPIVEAPEPAIEPEPAPVPAPAHLPRTKKEPKRPKPIEAPKEIPKEAPKEGNAEDFAVPDVPEGQGDPQGRVGGTSESPEPVAPAVVEPPPPPKKTVKRKPVHLPEDAKPPRMLSTSAPTFPASMKAEGREGLVILKVVIRQDGRITQWQVLQGDEPFLGAAIDWVKKTEWEPAISAHGEKLPVFKILRIPFRLRI